MFDQDLQPEHQIETSQNVPTETKSSEKEAAPAGSDQDFNEKVDQKTKSYEEKVQEMEKRFEQHGSIGQEKVKFISAVQINRLRRRAEQKKAEFKQLAAEEKSKRFSVMLGETDQDMQKINFPYERVIDYVRGLNKLDETEMVKLEAIMDSMNSLKSSPEAEKVFLKALNKEKLQTADLQIVLNIINPIDLKKAVDDQQGQQIFEGAQAGAIIGIMNETDRLTLMEMALKSKPLDDACELIHALLVAGHLSSVQVKQLCDEGKIPDPQKTLFLNQIDQGTMLEKQQKYLAKIDRLANVNRGRTMENPLSKSFGAPAAFGLSALWGAMVALVNFKLHFDWNKPLESGAKAITDPYFLLGASAMGVGVAGTASIVTPEKFGKFKEGFSDFWKGPEELKHKAEANKVEIHHYLEIPLKQNPYLAEFLIKVEEFPDGTKKSGLEVVKAMITEQKAQKKDPNFSFQEIMSKSGPKQQEILKKAFMADGSKDINFIEKMQVIMTCLTGLELDNDQKFNLLYQEFKRKQGIKT